MATGLSPGILVSSAVGFAAGAALEPAFELPRQDAWARLPNRVLDVSMLAKLVTQGGITRDQAHSLARRHGFDTSPVDALIYSALVPPPLAQTLTLWRRFNLPDELWHHALTHEGIDQRYFPYLDRLKVGELAGLGDVAYGVVRGILPAPSWVPVAPPTSGDRVPRFPIVNLDPVRLAAQLGYDEDMLRLMVGRSGLSLAPGMAAQAFFRDLIGPNDYLLAIAEGDLRTEWGATVLDVSRQIITSHDAAELQLRGFLTRDQRLGYTNRHGMAAAESDLLYDLLGRSVNVHQVLIGERRGGVFNGPTDQIPTAYLQALQRGNLRPEYYNLGYAARETYPSYFVTRALLQGRVITPTRGRELFLGLGWPTDVAEAAATFYGGATATSTDPHVGRAETQLWTATHSSYVAMLATDQDATDRLDLLAIPADSQARILQLWRSERELARKQLTATQVKKAYHEAVDNPATGNPWTLEDARARLENMGYTFDDATTFLEE